MQNLTFSAKLTKTGPFLQYYYRPKFNDYTTKLKQPLVKLENKTAADEVGIKNSKTGRFDRNGQFKCTSRQQDDPRLNPPYRAYARYKHPLPTDISD